MVSEIERYIDQYITWKLKKVIGNTILGIQCVNLFYSSKNKVNRYLLYLSMSLSFIPQSLSGGFLDTLVAGGAGGGGGGGGGGAHWAR